MRAQRSFALTASLALFTVACSGDKASEGNGTVVVAVGGDPTILLPPLTNTSQGRLVADQVFERLAELPTAPGGPFQPRLADSWEWSADSLSIAFHLNPKARWHDGKPVTARDVAFTWRLSSDSTSGSPIVSDIKDIDSVTVRDSLTPVFWFHRRTPTQLFTATYQLFIVPEHLLKDVKAADLRTTPFGHQPVGSGRFRFASWVPNQKVELVADTANYRGRPGIDRLVVLIAPDYNGAMNKVLTGEADFYETMRPESFGEIAKHADLKSVGYANTQYGFVLFNQRARKGSAPHPVFGNRAVRVAFTQALDRGAMVKNVLDSLGAVGSGPAPSSMPFHDAGVQQIAYSPEAANKALDSLGYAKGADGMRAKGGKPLAFSLLVPNSSQNRVKFAVLIQEALRQVGVKVDVEQVDFPTFQARLRAHDFDAAINALATDPVPSAALQSWGTAAANGGSNYGGYQNPAFDALIDSGTAATDAAKAKDYLHRAYQTIVSDAPAVWLYEPRLVAAAHKRLQPATLRSDAWWANLADWKIPADQRIPRDKIGLRQVNNAQ